MIGYHHPMPHCDAKKSNETPALTELSRTLEVELLAVHGPMVGGNELSAALGFRTNSAFRQALVRDMVPVPVFSIKHRRGKFALTREVAHWIAEQRQSAAAGLGTEAL
jgi:hypothetical protein